MRPGQCSGAVVHDKRKTENGKRKSLVNDTSATSLASCPLSILFSDMAECHHCFPRGERKPEEIIGS